MLIDRKNIRAFTGHDAEQRAEHSGHWLKAICGIEASKAWCIEHRVPVMKAQSETINTAGGFLVPEDFDAAVLTVRESVGAFRRGVGPRPSKSGTQVRPKRSGTLTASWTAEGAAITESSFTLDAITATQKKLAILCRDSTELYEDSAPDLAEYIAVEVGFAFGGSEDDAAFNGDGTSTFAGITGFANKLTTALSKSAIAAGSGVNTFAAITATDIGAVVAGVMGSAIVGAKWYAHPRAMACFARLAATGGGLVTVLGPNGEIVAANYLGFPVFFSAKLPDGSASMVGKPMLYFGNLALSSVLVEKRNLTVTVSFDRSMDTDQVLLRGTERLDIIHHATGDATTYGPVAALLGTS